jgi:hypothetical protein
VDQFFESLLELPIIAVSKYLRFRNVGGNIHFQGVVIRSGSWKRRNHGVWDDGIPLRVEQYSV